MTPELVIIVVNLIFLGFAYLWVYPTLPELTLSAILWRDLGVTAAALLVAALLFYGSGTRFSLLFFDANWAVFSIVSFSALDIPLFLKFARKHDLDL